MKPVTFLEALQFAESRKIVLPNEFYALDLKTRQLATTVRFLSSIEQIETVINAVNKAIANGTTFNDFKKLLEENEIILNDYYLKNVYRTNIQTAYGHGRWQQQQRNKDKRPYLMYSAIDDSRVRPSHLALNRIIRHIDDPFWLRFYPPWDFMCRCTVIALTEAQAQKLGITSDNDLPDIAANNWSTSPLTFGEMEKLVDDKIAKSSLDKKYLLEQKQAIQAEWKASAKLTRLLEPMNDKSRDLFKTISEIIVPLDHEIRPSAIKVLIDYVQGNDSALTAYLSQSSMSIADDMLKKWVRDDMAKIHKIAANTSKTIIGNVPLAMVASLEVGQVMTLNSPLLLGESSSNVIFQIEKANGLAIDLSLLKAGGGWFCLWVFPLKW
ncbi:Phage Mu protein F like protein [Acinetobacter stercoris]|uniref:Phage Mu protein F like protein n=1 Tax=Acinetobacter stercoris TaxID=2126983 RepID=A0A2U3MXZ9_9GAMM|nr:Phage Mu protein F like protein [Acinetobacter stercoris]